jgi:hypothetical protein
MSDPSKGTRPKTATWIATVSESPCGLVALGQAHLAYVAALNGAYTRTACGAIAMAFRAAHGVPRCLVCSSRPDWRDRAE